MAAPNDSVPPIVLHIWPPHESALSIDAECVSALLYLQLTKLRAELYDDDGWLRSPDEAWTHLRKKFSDVVPAPPRIGTVVVPREGKKTRPVVYRHPTRY